MYDYNLDELVYFEENLLSAIQALDRVTEHNIFQSDEYDLNSAKSIVDNCYQIIKSKLDQSTLKKELSELFVKAKKSYIMLDDIQVIASKAFEDD